VYEITVTPEFEAWFGSLRGEAAERVAAELNVLERAGPGRDLVHASRLLLWFDGTESAVASELGEGAQAFALQLRMLAARLVELKQRQQGALCCLESPTFLARFLNLDAEHAQEAHASIERLRAAVRTAVVQLTFAANPWSQARFLASAAQQDPARAGATPWNVAMDPSLSGAVQRALCDVLARVGLAPEDVTDTESGLRELTISDAAPPMRLIYAIDVPQRRILAILGEALDRAYYGDSVQLAERRWREYCRESLAVAPIRDAR
jgi:hypothetical protein